MLLWKSFPLGLFLCGNATLAGLDALFNSNYRTKDRVEMRWSDNRFFDLGETENSTENYLKIFIAYL